MNDEPRTSQRRLPLPTPLETHLAIGLGVLLAAGLLLRLVVALWLTGAIETEGAVYARIAQNLVNGTGYVGIVTPGPEVVFPPFYPLLIATLAIPIGDFELAARLISVVAGAALGLPVFGLARRLFGKSTGLIAAGMVAFHPFLITLSSSTYVEPLYITLLFLGLCSLVRAFEVSSFARWAVVGMTFAMAYLTRQEAAIPLAMGTAVGVIFGTSTLKQRLLSGVAACAVFAVAVAPFVAHVYRNTGRFDGKSAVQVAFGTRLLAGQTPSEAEHAIDDKLQGTGLWMRPLVELIRETSMDPSTVRAVVVAATRQNGPRVVRTVSDGWLGGPILLALATVGVFNRPWTRANASTNLLLLQTFAASFLTAMSTPFSYTRYTFVLVPFLMIWSSGGLAHVFRWTKASVGRHGMRSQLRIAAGSAFCAVLLAALFLHSLIGLRSLGEFRPYGPPSRAIEDVAKWIRQQGHERRTIMDNSTLIAFHAGADWIHFPHTDERSAIGFLDVAGVDYVVVRGRKDAWGYDYEAKWFDSGIPDLRAELVYESSAEYFGGLKLFRWHREAR